MPAKHGKTLVIIICLSLAPMAIIGCAIKTAPGVDVKMAGDSIVDARESIARARGEEASEHAAEEFTRAESLLKDAQELLRKGKNREAADLAFQADVEAKIATALTRENKARRRSEEIKESKLSLMWEVKTDEAAAAKARQIIAEKKALEAQKEVERVKAQAEKEIERARTELVVAKAELEVSAAEKAKAAEYAQEPYAEAKSWLDKAESTLSADDFQNAISAAEEASKNAATALIQAKAKSEALAEESLRDRDRAVSGIAKAEFSLAEAKEALVLQHAKDMYDKAENTLRDASLALDAEEYKRAQSLAEQARVSASGALAVSEAKDRELQEKAALEDIKANALDAVARAERNISRANDAGAEELAQDDYNKAQESLTRAREALQAENFEEVLPLVQESIAHSATALVIAEAKTERAREIERIENGIMEGVKEIPEASARRTNRGVVISIGGDLFSKGGSQIRKDVYPRMQILAELLKKYPDYKVVIEGHTDSIGSDEANLKISSERANNFLRHLVTNAGIPLERLSAVGYGESRPIASNINEAGRRQNRRVDIVTLITPVSP